MKRRFLAWLLCTVMLFNNALPVFATETTEHVHSEDCSEDCTLGTPVTTDTGDEDDATDPENQPEQTTNQPENGNNGQHNGQNNGNGQGNNDNGNHNGQNKCETCKKNPCECCTECKQYGSHASDCIHYVDPDACETCKKNPCECCLEGCAGDSHAEGCPNAPKVETTTCPNCEATYNVGDEHSCNCADCVEPWTEEHTCPTCKFCGVNMFGENIVHAENCHTFCKCNAEFGTAHADGYNCPLFTDHPFCDCEYFRNEEGTLTHADGCIKNYTCTVCQNKGHKEENCPECPLCINVEGATEHKGEKCKLYCDTCSAIVPEGAAHIDTCYKDKTCEVCGAVGKHLTVNCTECPACKEVSGNHDFNKKCKFANPTNAEVYMFDGDIHTKVDAAVIDITEYQDIYILKSSVAQNIKLEYHGKLNFGAEFEVSDNTNALLTPKTGRHNNVTVTLAPDANKVIVTAHTLLEDIGWSETHTVTIHVVDELIIKKPENNITTTIEGTTINIGGNVPTDVTIAASVVESYHAEVLEYVESAEEILFAYDITPVDADGNPWQPQDGEAVTVTLDVAAEDGKYIQILHVHNDGEIEVIGPCLVEYRKITFTVSKFSAFYGSFIDFSSAVGNNFMLTSGGSDRLSDILAAIYHERPDTVIDRVVNSDDAVTSSNTDLIGVIKTTTEFTTISGSKITKTDWSISAKTAFDSSSESAYLTVQMTDGKTLTINALYAEAVFGLKGAHNNWNCDPHGDETITIPETVTENGVETTKYYNAGTYDVFNKVIYSNDAENSNYVKDTDDVPFGGNYKVYLRPGMAFAFSDRVYLKTPDGTDGTVQTGWSIENYKNGDYTFDGWTWIYDNDEGDKKNYVIAQEVDDYTICRIEIVDLDKDPNAFRYIELHIIPYNTPQLLRDYLGDRTDYTIKEVPATLFDYEGRDWNNYYSNKYSDLKYFAFTSADGDKSTDASKYGYDEVADQANTGSRNANQGLVNQKLDANGLPVMSQAHQVDLFSTTDIENAKKVYDNVGFEFIYDSDGYYNYNSELNHAQYKQYDDGTKKIELYTQSMSASDSNAIGQIWTDQNPKAGFYPFADINQAFISRDATGMTVDQKLARLSTGVNDADRLNGDLAKDFVTTNKKGSTVDMYFGVHLESEFYLPKGKQLKEKDMIYEFTGDDDLWVFIDGQLVLDVGGGHTPVSGRFNLTTGDVWVEKFYRLSGDDGGYYDTKTAYTSGDTYRIMVKDENEQEYDFLDSLAEDQMHTISIFYLERFSGESNCRMRFNLPIVPTNGVEVSKKLLNQDEQPLSVTPDEEYTFQIYVAEDNDDIIEPEQQFHVLKNERYNGALTTDENGIFKLKAGSKAVFGDIPRFAEVYVVELTPDADYVYDGASVIANKGIHNEDEDKKFNDEEAYTEYQYGNRSPIKIVQSDYPLTFDFTNYMKTQPLKIEKEMVGGTNGIIDPNHNFNFNLAFTQDCQEISSIATTGNVTSITVTDGESENADLFYPSGTFTLQQGQSVTIPRVPVNMTYTVSESDPTSDEHKENGITFDKPKFNNIEKAFGEATEYKIGETNTITVTNKQRFTITITKNTNGVNPDQSFKFMLQGKNDHNKDITNEVVIPYNKFVDGSATITITGLPVGEYQITEDQNWSWRYSIDTEKTAETENDNLVDKADTTAVFTNKRTEIYWMDGEAWAQNLFTGSVGPNNPKGKVKKPDGSGWSN